MKRRYCLFIIFSLLCFFIFLNFANAEEPYDVTTCWSGDMTFLSASKDLVIYTYDIKGIAQSNIDNKAFDNHSFHMFGTGKVEAGNRSGTSYAKYLSPEGDIMIGEVNTDGDQQTFKILMGTGRWKGITGGGITKMFTKAKPIEEGTFQGCARATGTFQLPQ